MSRCAGFSLIEVLIALLLIGTGALALVMLQLHALRSSHDSSLQARATLMAQELAELRAAFPPRPGAADAGLFTLQSGPGQGAMVDMAGVAGMPDCSQHACSREVFLQAALSDWRQRLQRDFPAARAVVCRDGSPHAQRVWHCDHDAAATVMLKLGWRRPGHTPTQQASMPLLTMTLGR